MSDDAFHLTPLDVRRFEFDKVLRGYDPARVDAFREQVADELERVTRLNTDLEAKARSLGEQLRSFRDRDRALNDALVSAQQLRGEIKEQADREAELILREARAEAARIADDARAATRNVAAEMDSLDRSRRAYLTQLKTATERQLAEIESLLQTSFAERVGRQQDDSATPASSHPTPAWLKSLAEE